MRLGPRVKSVTTSSGQGDLTLGAAAPRHLAVSTLGLAADEVQWWLIEQGDAWEIGWYAYNAGVVRRSNTGFLAASSTGSKLNLSGATAYVSVAELAQGEAAMTPTATPSLGSPPLVLNPTPNLLVGSLILGPAHQASGSVGEGRTTAVGQFGVSSGDAGAAIGLQANAGTRNVSLGYLAAASSDGYSMQYWTAGGSTAVENGHILIGPRLDRPWPAQRSRGTRNDSLPLLQELDVDLYETSDLGSNVRNMRMLWNGITEMTLAQNRALAFDVLLAAVRLSDGAAWARRFEGVATRLTGNIALQGTPLETAISATAGFAPSAVISAQTLNQNVRIQVTGTDVPIRWHARVRALIGKLT